jgi:hypothetical protein
MENFSLTNYSGNSEESLEKKAALFEAMQKEKAEAEKPVETKKPETENKSSFDSVYHMASKKSVMEKIVGSRKDFSIADMSLRKKVEELNQRFLGNSGEFVKEGDINRIKQKIKDEMPFKQGSDAIALRKYLDILNKL